ncbi:MAG: foldase protein PrsA [Bacteroidales bacterium]|jgi:peptidyl-prolyl cis-trans isomerase SurA|nr:peptidylprolyl isomerase [Bacteroidales bacterium]
MNKIKHYFLSLTLLISAFMLKSQDDGGVVVDEVVVVIGKNFILHSDIESQYLQLKMQYGLAEGGMPLRCHILENMMFQKLLVNQAQLDSVVVSDAEVNDRIDRNLRYFVSQFGSRAKLEEFYKKSFAEIKEELRQPIKEQLISEHMQERITQNVQITPAEVMSFFNEIDVDSIPLMPAQYELQEIVKIPKVGQNEYDEAYNKINGFRDRILKGESFSTIAVLYSEDPGSMSKGGELGFFSRGDMFPEFEAAAFSLRPGEVSPITKTKAGYHILQLIERRGELINVRHLLIQAKPSIENIAESKNLLDSVYTLVESGQMSFDSAAFLFSDINSKNSGGLMINPYTGTSYFEAEHIDKSLIYTVDKLNVGEFSKPIPMQTEDGKQAYRIVRVKTLKEPHKANLKDDYDKIQTAALEDKKAEIIAKWINNNLQNTFVKIKPPYDSCEFDNEWIK